MNKNTEFLETMRKDLSYWRGPFYFNRNDPRIFVKKLDPSLGYTLNFGNFFSYMLILAFIAIVWLTQQIA